MVGNDTGKNIVLCSDGTGATAAKNRGTNVFKLYETIELHGHEAPHYRTQQVAFYDDGVGTEKLRPLRLLGGAFGLGFSRNVRQLYAELARAYEPGDRVYLFGFSRGAFTVRTLAGLIAQCGVLDWSCFENDKAARRGVRQVYRTYRLSYATALQRFLDRFLRRSVRWTSHQARHWFSVSERVHKDSQRVHFIGVWDTVDAVGFPIPCVADAINTLVYRFKFPSTKLSPRVDRARHALSIDDARLTFHPVVWDETDEAPGRIEQVWFAGVHSNVGGGYEKQGMSLVALDWMVTEAAAAGLRFVPAATACHRAARNADDHLYDSRAWVAFLYRYWPRDIWRVFSTTGAEARVHVSVLERLAMQTEGYSPGGIPRGTQFVATRHDADWSARVDQASTRLAEYIAGELDLYAKDERHPRAVSGIKPVSLLDLVPHCIASRHHWHIVFLLTLMGIGSVALFVTWTVLRVPLPATPAHWLRIARVLWGSLAAGEPLGVTSAALIVLALLSLLVIARARRRMRNTLSAFWHHRAPELRARLRREKLWPPERKQTPGPQVVS